MGDGLRQRSQPSLKRQDSHVLPSNYGYSLGEQLPKGVLPEYFTQDGFNCALEKPPSIEIQLFLIRGASKTPNQKKCSI